MEWVGMRFKEEIFQEYKRFSDEQRHLDFHREKDRLAGKERLPFWGEMEFTEFNRLFNTIFWLQKFNSPWMIRAGESVPVKPTSTEIVEVAERIKACGEDLRIHARQHSPGDIKKDLQKMATKQIKCGNYYTALADDGFFDDKELTLRDIG